MIQFDEHIFQKGWFNHQLDDINEFFHCDIGGAIRVARDDAFSGSKWGAKEPQNPQNHKVVVGGF